MLGLTTVYMLEDSKVFVPAVYFADFWTLLDHPDCCGTDRKEKNVLLHDRS